MISRWGTNHTDKFAKVADQLGSILGRKNAVLDGEMVGFNAEGAIDLESLKYKSVPAAYIVFDLLELDGEPLIGLPLTERRRKLKQVVRSRPTDDISISRVITDRDAALSAALALDQEGVVAKRNNSIYRPGRRSSDWLKLRFRPGPPAAAFRQR